MDPNRVSFSTGITLTAHNRNNRELKAAMGYLYWQLLYQRKIMREDYVASYGIIPLPYTQHNEDLIKRPEVRLGMDKTTYFISLDRLAPVQAVWWGNADTSGVPTMDYYLTSEHEHKNSNAHYSEAVYRFKLASSTYTTVNDAGH
ncbi:unnamed protein product [Phytophthora lilii]|uniref:Unnamed protein product n=1 Tax=Phytophthora lilii TaxID=2077276 RepID=A0A9W6WRN1_9STRA|nr:unnamed protein product [Phytophthora lilii]